jgi:tetratricopeptide (TPR) repeat protein
MAAKKRTQSKSKQASKSKSTKSLKAKPAKKKAISTKKKTTSKKKKVISKAKKASASKKPAAKKKTTKKKAASSKPQVRAKASKKKAAPAKASASKKTKRPTKAKAKATKKSTQRPRLSTFSAALNLYETGFKLMQSEKFDKAKKAFDALIKEFPNETELLDRAHVLTQACDNRIREARKTPRPQGADEYYEVGIAELNGQDIDKALEHLQNALKLSPKADHIHYALAAASALNGDREAALDFLGKAIQYRDENRFLAVNDEDFESLSQDSDFIGLIAPDAG